MKLRTAIHRVRLGPTEYRVLVPARPAAVAVLHRGDWSMEMRLDRAGAEQLAAAWALAARSRRSLVFLPLRSSSAGVEPDRVQDRLDLLLAHHSLGLPATRWKEIRGRLGPGVPHTADLPESDFPPEDAIDHDRRFFAGWRDELRFAGAARTLLLTGSATAFRWTGSQLRAFAREAPGHRPRPGARDHYCLTLRHADRSSPKGVDAGELHIVYAPGGTVG